MPPWASAVLTVPFVGMDWFLANLEQIHSASIALAKSVNDHVFVLAAGPIATALVPIMTKSNPKNTYLDIGGTLDFELTGIRTREFQPKDGMQTYMQAGGAIQNAQMCTESRWTLENLTSTHKALVRSVFR